LLLGPETRQETPLSRPRAALPSTPATPTGDIHQRVRALGPWYHNLDLHGVRTAPEHFLGDYPENHFQYFAHAVPPRLDGRSVLDIGCNGGFYSLEMKRRGAARVLGIDADPRYLEQARFAAGTLGLDVEFRRLSVYAVAELGERFDIVLFMGVLYHLRHPLLALDLLHAHVVADLLIFQSMLRGSYDVAPLEADYPFEARAIFDRPDVPKLHFIERSYAGDPTNWWVPNRACVEAMLRSAGFEILERPDSEVFICRRRPDGPGPGWAMPAREGNAWSKP
jgi:tRNA (mo5U34)-methyltransferase